MRTASAAIAQPYWQDFIGTGLRRDVKKNSWGPTVANSTISHQNYGGSWMRALYSIAELRQTETSAAARLSTGTLMQRAGSAAARLALSMLQSAPGKNILVLAGPGNNGGDALEAAQRLAEEGCRLTVLLFAEARSQPLDARNALERVRDASHKNLHFADPVAEAEAVFSGTWDLVIDGLFGIGLRRTLPEPIRRTIESVNRLSCPILALDVPSGLNADTGNPVGDNPVAIHADVTLSYIGDKPGLHTGHGRDHAGVVEIDTLDIDPAFFPEPTIVLNEPKLFAADFRPRRHGSHKGSFGTVAVLGGSTGMAGAAILASRAALYAGAGRVVTAFVDVPSAYDATQPELMCRDAASADLQSAVVVAGPGLGEHRAAQDALVRALGRTSDMQQPLVLDADALNLIAAHGRMQQQLARRRSGMILTPHPLEAARLLGTTALDVQANRITAARMLADRFNAVIILKGSGTVIASPQSVTVINQTGNPALATAGTGDVLAGLCGALLAQGVPLHEAALAAVWLHGRAADQLVERGIGPIGMTATELLPEIRRLVNQLASGSVTA